MAYPHETAISQYIFTALVDLHTEFLAAILNVSDRNAVKSN
jgi:hypothetical protein